MNCLVCDTKDEDKPMVFRGEEHCSDNHRKVISGEREPTVQEWNTMDRDLYLELGGLGGNE